MTGAGWVGDYPVAGQCVLRCVEDIAADVARLRRRDLGGAYWTVERIASRVDTIDTTLWPTAGELVRHGVDVDEALALVDRRQAHLWHLLGGRPVV